MGHYFGNHGKKAMAMATKIFVTQSILPKSITKNKMSDKTKKEKKKKEKKSLLLNTLNVDAKLNFAAGNGCKNERHQSEQKRDNVLGKSGVYYHFHSTVTNINISK